MEIKEFIAKLNLSNFSLSVDNGMLNLTGDKKKLSAAEIDGIKSNKDVIDYIRANKNEIIEYLTLYNDLSSVKKSKNISSIYRLSGLQQGMLFHSLYDGETEAYKVQFKCDLNGLNEQAFTDSWNYLLQRHTVLRSGFYYDAFNVPVQCVYNDVTLPVEIVDLRGMNEQEQKAAAEEYAKADLRKSFDFKAPPLMRVGLLRLSNKLHQMQWTSHHILFDGWSLPILMEEFLSTYELLASGKKTPVVVEDKYEDYIRYIERADKVKQEAYWRNYLRDVEQGTLLPFIETTAERTKGAGSFQSATVTIDAAATLKIQNFAQENRLTVSTIIQGVWAYLLHRYTGNDHIVFGVVVSGRPEDLPGVEKRVGVFINTLPLHSVSANEVQVVEWLHKLQLEQISSRQYQHTPLSDVQQWTGVQGDFFDSLLVFENYPVSKIIKSNQWSIGIENVRITDPTNYPLTILVNNTEQITIHFNYNSNLLADAYIALIQNHFKHVLFQITESNHARLNDVKLLLPAEEKMLLQTFNSTKKAYPENRTVNDLFEAQANRTPGNIAQVFQQTGFTYQELNEKVNQLAHYLLQHYNLQADDTVGVLLNRSEWSAIAMLAIIKTGACYVPIDYELPTSRLQYIVGDSAPKLILTGDEFAEEYSFLLPGGFVSLTSLALDGFSKVNPGISIHLDSLSYIIYTSGSTGNPKGVMQTHRTLINLVNWDNASSGINAGLKLLQYSSFSFDFSLLDVYFSLSNGGCYYVVEETLKLDFPKLATYISNNGIEVLSLPFSALSSFFNNVNFDWLSNNHIKHIISTGEQLLIGSKLDEFIQLYPHITLHNFYGPSETHVVTAASFTYQQLQPRHATIGKPIDNSTIYILDKQHTPVPIGVAGELFIGGDNLARGYLKNKELTDEKFVPHFFNDRELLYRTGDIGRWLLNGNIEYLGRMDDQVKIRGYRIELGEIENVLQQSGFVQQAVVLAKKDKSGYNRLVGYAMADGALDRNAILQYLQRKVPDYMIPALWIELETLPLTPNGKVDKRALPDPDKMDLISNDYVAPRNNLEQKLVSIWQEILGVEKVGIHNNFFEIGGHSLLAMRVISLVRRQLQTEVGIKDLFTHPTIAELADYIRNQSGEVVVPQITITPRPENIPLSFSQERLWFVDRFEGSLQYHIPALLRLKGRLNVQALQYAFQNIVGRHEALRTIIQEQDGTGYQVVQEKNKWQLVIADEVMAVEDASQLAQAFINQPFDLTADYLLRASLITLTDEEYVLVVVMHHIASDGWSLSILVREVIALYEAFVQSRVAKLEPLPIQYADYAIWQRAYLQGDIWDKKLGYWKAKLEGVSPLQLPTDFARPAIQNLHGASVSIHLDSDITGQLKAFSQQYGATLFMTLIAAFKTLLYRYSGQPDICVGTPTANRTIQEVENLIGFFINTLALRSQVIGSYSFVELLQQVKQTTLEAYTHQDVPFEKVVDAVVKQRDMSRNPLVQAMFILQNIPDIPQLKLGEVALTKDPFTPDSTRFEVTFSFTETAGGLHGSVQYSTALFRKDTVERMVAHFKNLLHAIVVTPEQNIAALPMLDKAEENQLLKDFNNTTTIYPKDKNIVLLLEEQVIKSPENIALQLGQQQLTYQELNERSNQLAHYLRTKGVTQNVRVPICLEKSFEMIIGIIAILKAGAAYVPIDTAYPADRIRFMIQDSKASIILSANKEVTASKLAGSSADIFYLDSQWDEIQSFSADNLQINIQPEHLVYVLYTSGSTGKPKGVQVQHHSFTNHLLWFNQQYHITEKDSTIFLSSFSFDGGMTALWPVLMNGGTLHLPKQDLLDADWVLHYLANHSITYLKTLPGIFKAIVQRGTQYESLPDAVRLVVMGGEKITVSELKKYIHNYPHIVFANHYGPTECTISSSYFRIDKNSQTEFTTQSIVGKPIANTSMYVVNEMGRLNPAGVFGEIYIGGTGVAQGYLNNPELTAAKFIADPFSTIPGARLYKTGDTGRWLADGNIEYIGRLDDQVKIRGYRIELSEIETVLQQSGLVQQAVVVATEDSTGNQRLVGYVAADSTVNKEEIITWLKGKLPEYMVPQAWVQLEQMPRTANGKIDKKSLPDADVASTTTNEYVAPRNSTEEKIAGAWMKLLNKEQVGIHDNFFDLGGHSLLAMRVVSLIRKTLDIDIAIKDLFIYPTVAALATHVSAQTKATLLPDIEVQTMPQYIPLSFSQERLWFMDQLHGSVQYHLPAVLQLTGELKVDALKHALQQIVNRHQILRTVIRENNGQGYQYVLNENGMQLSVVDGAKYENDRAGLQAYVQSLINKPFDISQNHMVRAELVRQQAGEHLLIITMHHIASDKWSSSIFVKEVAELYDSYVQNRNPALLSLPIQYADYAIWQRKYLNGDFIHKKLDYWKEKLKGVEPLELPVDYPRPLVQSNMGNITVFNIDKQLVSQLNSLSRRQGSTLFMTLLAAFKILLHRYSGQNDICVGTSTAGRQQHEVENLVGLFVNLLALRTTVNSTAPFNTLLQQVKQTTLEAYSHQEVPFEKVVDTVVQERNMSRSPLFQVMLVMLNTPEVAKVELDGLTISGTGYEINSAKYDITFFINETTDGISASVEYSTELFSEQTICRMVAHFDVLLQSIVANPQQPIAELNMLSKAGEQQLLVEFNNTTIDYPQTSTVAALFEAQVTRTPLSTAIMFGDERITYQQLNERCNQVANHLLTIGIRPGTNIGLLSHRCMEMMIAMLGIVKAGCAYVPINTDYPKARIDFIVEDAAIEHIVYTSKVLLQTTGLQKLNSIDINDVSDSAVNSPVLNTTVDACVYIMFTSGTTGRPKGIAVSHQNITKLVYDDGPIRILPGDCVLQWSNYSFDGSTYDIYSSLLSGAALCLISDNQVADADELASVMQQQHVTVCFITTALFNTLVDVQATALKGLRKILFGGEMASFHHVKKALTILGPDKIVHVYGPTETTVYAASYPVNQVEAGTGIPIGKPLSNTQFYVLDDGRHLVPVGVPGELYIGGHGVSIGYINNELLSNEKFITNPFTGNANDRLYQTGDMVRWLSDGNIEYLSRKDHQVKIRGFRIELGEIEAVLQQLETVRYAVVVASTDQQGARRLIGYVVPNEGYDKQLTLQHLKTTLPEYMVPAMLLEIAELPLNANGKIDRKALPTPEESNANTNEFVAPRNHNEQVLASIWADLLDLDKIGVHDNFFETGGDSLLAIRVVSAIRRELATEVSISSFFEHQTIAALASHIETNTNAAALPTIIPAARPPKIPLSFSQQRLWFIHKLEGSTQYHIPAVLRLKGQLNRQALQFALSSIINRHEVLRTIFPEQGGEPWQQIKEAGNWHLTVTDGVSLFQDTPALQKRIQQIISAPFDLSADTMLRANLITLTETENVLIINLHHIASDGWSRAILVKEVAELYTAFEQGRQPALSPLPVQYADFSIWQQNYLHGELLDNKLNYWVNKLKDVAPIQIPADFMRPPVQTSRGGSVVFSFDKETTTALQQMSQQNGSTLFMTLLTALKTLLYRYTGSTDICVGTASAGRQQQEVEGLIGFFVNTLALRSAVQPDDSFENLLKQVRQTTVEAYEHQDVPFEKIVDAITVKRDRSRNPVFQVMFVLQNTPEVPEIKLGNLTLSGENYLHNTAQFDLSFSLTEHAGGLAGAVVYNADIYLPETINRLVNHFRQLIDAVIKAPHKKISELEIISSEEKHQLLFDFNNTATSFPVDKTVIDLFEQQVQQTPDATAIIFDNQQLSYQQLNEQSNQFAHYLRSKGVTEEMPVPIFIERSLNMIVGILGILKAGAAYVPVDPDYPAERISFMLQDIAATILVTSGQCVEKLPATFAGIAETIVLDKDAEIINQQLSDNLYIAVQPNHLAYVIYTSGSTGRPKGVMIEHRNMYSFLCWCRQAFALSHFQIAYATTSMCFDLSVFELFYPLIIGKPVRMVENGLAIKDFLHQDTAVLINTVPSVIDNLLKSNVSLDNVSILNMAGEPIPSHIVQALDTTAIEVRNLYGPTEDTTYSTVYRLSKGKPVLIGKPLSNKAIYVVDATLQIVPVGVGGEICIAGDGVARGYLNRPELTAERFIPNPYSNIPGAKMYRTGDIGRWLPDGNIEYLGRADDQVKIRGYRIELGEIETVLQQSGLVQQSVVVAKADADGTKRLAGYVVTKDGFNREAVLTYLKTKLPEYMVPTVWIKLESLPLTANGKVDKKALPNPDAGGQLSTPYAAPRTQTESTLAAIWQQLLHIDKVGIHDNFFELGGHSLLAMRVIAAIHKELQVELAVKDIFQADTISELSKYVDVQTGHPEPQNADEFDLLVI